MIALPAFTEHFMPRLFQPHDYLNFTIAVAVAISALSLNILLGYAGQISLGHVALLSGGAFASGFVTSRWSGSIVFGMLFAVAVGAALAFIIGIPALRLRGLYLAIVTLAFAFAMRDSILPSNALSGGSAGVDLTRRIWGDHVSTDSAGYFIAALLLLLLVWVLDVNIMQTRLGRAFRAIREDEIAAQSFGIDVTRYKLLAFVISGGMAGLAGAVFGHAIGHVNSVSYDFALSLQLVSVVIIGGAGRRLPVVITAIVFTIFPTFITSLHYIAYIIGALALMATLAIHPDGIGDLLSMQQVRRHRAAPDSDDDELPTLPNMPAPDRATAVPRESYDGPLLEVSDVAVQFGGLRAVDGASIEVPTGKIVGLIGPNGAGKSTLFNAISGVVSITNGTVRYRGQEIQKMRSDQRARLGIARSFQQVGLAKDLTMRENFLLAQHQLTAYSDLGAFLMSPGASRSERELAQRADDAITALGFGRLADLPVRNLSGGQQRIVEIACLLVTAPELVMLDEPSAGMAPAAAESLASRLRDLRDAMGRTVLLIEHNVPLVLDTCDYIYVLDAGKVIAQGLPEEIASNQRVIDAYFGAAVAA